MESSNVEIGIDTDKDGKPDKWFRFKPSTETLVLLVSGGVIALALEHGLPIVLSYL